MGAAVTLLATNSGGNPYDEACSRVWWDLAEKFPDRPIPPACLAATVELRGMADVGHALGKKDAANIFLFLKRRGFIAGQAPAPPPLKNDATPLRGVAHVVSPATGVVVFLKAPGDRVEKGEVVAEIVDPLRRHASERIVPVESDIQGVFFARIADRYARPGRILGKIAGKNPIEGKGDRLLTA
jgi:predicted deacylase